ncbi:alcohol dehydrogenase catalytic domain-containing protein [Bradyrhizobium sp. RDM12]
MQAAVFHGDDRITIERVAMPEIGTSEVLVRVSRTALCGSDFKLWHKGAEFTAGHEIFGVIEQPGHCPARPPLRRLHSPALRTLRGVQARRYPDVPGNL